MSRSELPLAGLSVLIIEDEFLIAVDVQRIVEEAGASATYLANSVSSARAHFAGGARIDVAVLDIRLGNEDGGALIDDLVGRRVPFVIASGFGAAQAQPPGQESATVLTKPYRESDLIDALRSAFGGRRCR